MNDKDTLKFGKYKGCIVGDVPKKYFTDIAKNPDSKYDEIREFIKNKWDNGLELNKNVKLKDIVLKSIVPSNEVFICNKLTFPTQKDAKFALNKIQNTEQTHKKPLRVYECEICNGWHLTSQTIEEFKKYGKEI